MCTAIVSASKQLTAVPHAHRFAVDLPLAPDTYRLNMAAIIIRAGMGRPPSVDVGTPSSRGIGRDLEFSLPFSMHTAGKGPTAVVFSGKPVRQAAEE